MIKDFQVTISIVSHGDADKIHRLLASLHKSEVDLARFQLILTDNLLNEFPEMDTAPWGYLSIVRNKKPLGFAENHNRAFKFARGEYFAILNPDLIFERPVFDRLINSLNANHASLIAPVIVDENDTPQDSFRALPTPIEIIRRRLPGYSFESATPDEHGLIHPDWIAGMFWLMRSDFYKNIGGMDEKFRLYFEDVDFCSRARLADRKIVIDSTLHVKHQAQRSSRKSLWYLFLHIQSAVKFFASPVYFQVRRR